MLRYVRAFWVALRMTLRGEQPPPPPNAPLIEWNQRTIVLLDEVSRAAKSAGFDLTLTTVRIDGRDLTLEKTLAALRYRAATEYPSLLRQPGRHNLTAIYASNMNDRYWLACLLELDTPPAVKKALGILHKHFEHIPQKS
jgi:hypothetical protein